CRLRNMSGEYHWFLSRCVPQRDGGDRIERWIGSWTDIDLQRRSLEAFRLLADTGGVLGQSLDLKQMLDLLLPILVPRVCDWAVILVIGVNGDLVTASVLHRDVDLNRLAEQLIGKPYYVEDRSSPTFRALDTGWVQEWDRHSWALPKSTDPRFNEVFSRFGMRYG